MGKRGADELTQLLRGDVLARGIDRREIGGRFAVPDVEAAHVEAVTSLAPAQAHRRSRLQLALEPRLVEPGGGNGRSPVADTRRQHLQPPSPASRRRQHFSGDRHLLVCPEVGHPHLGHGLLVAKRSVRQQIVHGLQPEPLEPLLDGRPDARKDVDGTLELLRSRERARPRPLARVRAAKAHRQHYSDSRRHALSSNQKKPTVPGPACVPTTAPRVVTISTSACGRSACTIFFSCSARSGASACAIPTFSVDVSSLVEVNSDTNSCIAFWFPRTRLSGTTSRLIVRIGLTCNRFPAHALARPIRPPRRRNSSVSTVKIRPASALKRRINSSLSSSVVPRSSRRWIAKPSMAIAAEALSESTTRTWSPSSSAAVLALW